MLAVTFQDNRDPQFPDVPTLIELGYKDVPANPYVIYGPPGLPKDVTMKIETAFMKAARSAEFNKAVDNMDLSVTVKGSADMNRDFQKNHQLYSELLTSLGMARKK